MPWTYNVTQRPTINASQPTVEQTIANDKCKNTEEKSSANYVTVHQENEILL